MVNIKPFKGLRPTPDLVEKVAALPYDVSSKDEVMAKKINPYSFYHITRSEIDVATGAPINSKEVYEKAKENLDRFRNDGVLVQDEKECYYIYRISVEDRSQTGLVCCSALSDYENGTIKKHEFTRPERVQDRVDNMLNTGAHTGVVFLAYKAVKEIESLIAEWTKNHDTLYDFVAEDGVGHSFWIVDDQATVSLFTNYYKTLVSNTYIADGHHRSHAAQIAHESLGESDASAYYLTCIFPDTQVKIMDYNRVVRDLNDLTAEDFLVKLAKNFEIVQVEQGFKPEREHEFGMYLDAKWFWLKAKPGTFAAYDNIEVLDVSILQHNVLQEILGVGDPRVDTRVDFVGGDRSVHFLEKLVDGQEFAVAFTCFPVSMQQLFAVADSGKVMPPKSTWFEPKIRDGLVLNLIGNN